MSGGCTTTAEEDQMCCVIEEEDNERHHPKKPQADKYMNKENIVAAIARRDLSADAISRAKQFSSTAQSSNSAVA